jgi:hypothetical protein
MAEFGYTGALEVLSGRASVDLGRLLAAASGTGPDPVVYLADFARQVLLPLAAGVPEEPVTGTLAGRVFSTGEPAVGAAGDGAALVWVPVLEQTARIGVLAVAVADPSPAVVRQAELLGVFAGLVVTGLAQVSDAPRVLRHGRRMSLPASMQWDLLPPWALRVPGAEAAGILEPASLASDYDDLSFATGILGTLHLRTGRLEWTCAGHPPPLLLRDRTVIGERECATTTSSFLLMFSVGGTFQGEAGEKSSPVRTRRRHTRGEQVRPGARRRRPALHRRRDRRTPAARRPVRPAPAG